MISLRQATILVVDDSPTVQKVVTDMLHQMGVISVDRAANGEEAIAKIKASDYTLVISDWNMGPMDGLALLRAVVPRQTPRFNRFIFMTSERSWGHQTSARSEGADDFIAKPFKIETLKAKIEKVLARS